MSKTTELLLQFFISPYEFRKRLLFFGGGRTTYKSAAYQLKRRGVIKIVKQGEKKFLKLTKKGSLEALLAKAIMPVEQKWDGKWRLIIFDIPESVKTERNKLRRLLKQNNFRKLQGSVYINPYALNRQAVLYLKESGLINYIRIIKVQEMDSDADLKKKFKLK